MSVRRIIPGLLGLALAVCVGGGAVIWARGVEGWGRYAPGGTGEGAAEIGLRQEFLQTGGAVQDRYAALFAYFLRGFRDHATPDFERVQYGGAGNFYGFRLSGLEGFARTAPLLAAWLDGGHQPPHADVRSMLERAVLAGTDPASPTYWGDIGDNDQRLVEAADVARVLWLTRNTIWVRFDVAERRRVARWLETGLHVKTPANNWLLFPVTISAVLRGLAAAPVDDRKSVYNQFKTSYLQNGWFFDAPEGVDYYNAWAVAYELFWIDRIDPGFDRAFITDVLRHSAELTAHLISPRGIPFMGRSVCYRTAIPVPILAAAHLEGGHMTAGQARRALDVVWRHFVERGAVADGALTQGYYGADLRFLDRYSGPGSCQWGLRSLVLAFLFTPDSAFWTAPEQQLPVERGDYTLTFDRLGWVVAGRRDTGNIVISIPANDCADRQPREYTVWNRLAETVLRRPQRPKNHEVKYMGCAYGIDGSFLTRGQ